MGTIRCDPAHDSTATGSIFGPPFVDLKRLSGKLEVIFECCYSAHPFRSMPSTAPVPRDPSTAFEHLLALFEIPSMVFERLLALFELRHPLLQRSLS
jgi:hypothetical protein